MLERITGIEVNAFRGVPASLKLDFAKGRSTILYGENGTGKSTVADALEWFFTGRLDFLSHEGRKHAIRNVGADPDVRTRVDIATDGGLGGLAPYPGSPPSSAIAAAQCETFLLRGRTLVDFVDQPKAEKWRYLSQILGLQSVDQLRLDLQTVANDLKRELVSAQADLHGRELTLTGQNVPPTEQGILLAIRAKCISAGIPAPGSLQAAVDPNWAHQSPPQSEVTRRAVGLASIRASLPSGAPALLNASPVEEWNSTLRSSDTLSQLRLNFFSEAQTYLSSTPLTDECPLCGQTIEHGELAARIQATIRDVADATQRLQAAQEPIIAFLAAVEEIGKAAKSAVDQASGFALKLSTPPSAAAVEQSLDALKRRSQLSWDPLADYLRNAQAWVITAAGQLDAALPPTPSQRDQTLFELAFLISAAREWSAATQRESRARVAAAWATHLFQEYQAQQASHLELILARISQRVAELFTKLHPGEQLSDAAIVRSAEKGVELSITFHGTHQSPPHGVLSESHLNSLAIALFLAMAETFNTQLGFLVLDDVVNSFDSEHRGQLAQVLVEDFTERQLLVLTHDPLFYDKIRRYSPGWGYVEFTSWTYADGPRMIGYETSAILARAEEALPDDRISAAQKGRRALEELLQEICEGLEGPLPFRRGPKNDRREIGELLQGVRRLLKDEDRALHRELSPPLTAIEVDVATTLNVEAHASTSSASSTEVSSALARIRGLERLWTCQDCGTRVWHSGTPGSFHCRCNAIGFPGRLDLSHFANPGS